MRLKELLDGVVLTQAHADQEVEITSISYDTREIEKGALFVALPGYKYDGHNFICQALEKGAAAVLCQAPPDRPGPWLVTPDSRAALAAVSANWFGHPGDSMTLLAVTGTNGKTTTSTLLKAVIEEVLGTRVGLVGTNRNMVGDRELPAHRTTPESYELQALLRQMSDEGCTHVVMEASSHALVQRRTGTLRFTEGIFTNLTRDHLDYHGTMEEYRRAKSLLFEQSDLAILNLDDEAGRWYRDHVACPAFTYSERHTEADLTAENVKLFPDRVQFEAVARGVIGRVVLPIPGGFTIYNALAVIAAALNLGLDLPAVAAALSHAHGVKGRVEVVPSPAPYTIIIDYAHTPDALENILSTVRSLTQKRLLCVVGCGGDRDRSKRPLMGEIAGELADLTFLTSDNPRTEDPMDILRDMLPGMERSKGAYRLIPDRRDAIRAALAEARAGDLVLLAGKGHETYQEIMGETRHLDEREEVAAFFQNNGNCDTIAPKQLL